MRIEGIDALETHYEGYHQPRPFAIAALERLLKLLGIDNILYSLNVTTIVDADDAQLGFIAANGLDRYDRPIFLLFPASAKLTDGSILTSDRVPFEKSLNYILIREGLVYPTFYTSTDKFFAEKLRKATRLARKDERDIWAIDRTTDLILWDARTLQEDVTIMPKLFRRLVEFCDANADFSQLPAYMARQKDNLQLWDDPTPRSLASLMTFDMNGRRMSLATQSKIFCSRRRGKESREQKVEISCWKEEPRFLAFGGKWGSVSFRSSDEIISRLTLPSSLPSLSCALR